LSLVSKVVEFIFRIFKALARHQVSEGKVVVKPIGLSSFFRIEKSQILNTDRDRQ